MGRLIYADNAATTKLDIPVFESMVPWLLEQYGNASQPYSFARKPKRAPLEVPKVITGLSKVLLFQTRVNEQ